MNGRPNDRQRRPFELPWRSGPRIEAEFEEELAIHRALRTDALLARGLTAEEAERIVAREEGDLDDARRYVNAIDRAAESRRTRRHVMQHLLQEASYSLRRLRREPGFTLVAVATLALGLGAWMLMFNVVAGALFSPLPFGDPDRAVVLFQYIPSLDAGSRDQPIGGRELQAIHDNVRSFEAVAGFRPRPLNVESGDVERWDAIEATGDFFAALGVHPELGRFFSRDDEVPRGDRPVVLSDALWRRRFGARVDVIGRIITLNGEPYVIAGVAPPAFAFPRGPEMPPTFQLPPRTEAWIPIATPRGGPDDMAVVARLRRGATIGAASQELDGVRDRMLEIYPQGKGFFGVRAISLRAQLVGRSERLLLSLLAAVALLLLVASLNAAQLQLAHLERRGRDFAVRAALGAPSWRIVLGSAIDVILVSIAADVIATVLAVGGYQLIRARLSGTFPLLATMPFDARTVAVALGVALGVGVMAGVGPAVASARRPLIDALRRRGARAGGERTRRTLIVVEVALAVVLVAVSSLMTKSLSRQLSTELGFSPVNGLTFEVTLPRSRYPERQGPTYMEHPAGAPFITAALERLRAIPGVQAAGMGKPLPLSGSQEWSVFTAEGREPPADAPHPGADYTVASGGMFSALGSPLVAGRDFDATDREDGVPVVIVNQSMARWLWPGTSALGKRIRLGTTRSATPWMTVIGVAADFRRYALTDTTRPEMIVPYTQKPYPSFSTLQFVVRSELPPASLTPAIQRAIAQVDRSIPISNIRTVSDLIAEASTSARFGARFMTVFGGGALFLAMIGLYGVVSYAVVQRRQEFGIRRALGASDSGIVRLVAREAGMLACGGAVIGLAVAVAGGIAIRSLLYGVTAYDATSLGASIGVILVAAIIACVAPALRALRVDPRTALEES